MVFHIFCIAYCSENRLKINVKSYGEHFYYLTYRDKIFNLEGYILFSFYHKEIMGWTFGFPEITEIASAH